MCLVGCAVPALAQGPVGEQVWEAQKIETINNKKPSTGSISVSPYS
jgi:hypothetical protein